MRTSTQTAPETAAAQEDKKKPEAKAEDSEPEEGEVDEKQGKKKTGKAPRKALGKKASKGERKRGPARPYRKLPQETLDLRIKKLQKRIERTSAQAEEGKAFLVKYTREHSFRESEPAAEA